MYALVMAGGSGTRLWPHSRSERPKQFLPLCGETTMLQETVERVLPLIPIERIYVATGAAYVELVREQLPGLPPENVLSEPCGRGTAPCIGLAALHLLRQDPDAVMAVLSADHRVEQPELFCRQLTVGAEIAMQGFLVTLGITPDTPATGYGYIECGELLYADNGEQVFHVRRFVEKPDLEHARAYIKRGNFFWNAGMFVWRADQIMQELAHHRPMLAQGLNVIGASLGGPHADMVIETIWPHLENVAIDVAVMEQARRVVVIPSNIGWSDLGDWAALAEMLPQDIHGNATVGNAIQIDTRNTLIYGNGRIVATIGVEDLVIVDTHDVLLVCPRHRTQDVKAMVAEVRRQHQHLA